MLNSQSQTQNFVIHNDLFIIVTCIIKRIKINLFYDIIE